MTNPYQWIEKSLLTIHQVNWYRSVTTIDSLPGAEISINGQKLINFASNDYLGLAGDKRLIKASIEATQKYGTGSTGSRLLSGHRDLHQTLEKAIANLKQTEDALIFSSGYLANLGTITALVGQKDLILGDNYNHSSLKNGAKLSGATYLEYGHNNIADLHNKLQENRQKYRRCLMVSDSVFSMDGDLCPLPDLISLAESFECMLLIDEAHATGVMGKTGAGCREYFDCDGENLIQMGTLSKALGSLGGYVAGSGKLIDFLRNRAATWIYTTGLSPADTAAALTAIDIIKEEPQRRENLWHNVTFLREKTAQFNLISSNSAILCVGLANAETALNLAKTLKKEGIFAPAIRPPTVPTSRLRFSVMATHTLNHLQQLITILEKNLIT
ncbi:8-amino-7-oxononanoate synthase [Aphanothece sacrum]|uniref:8-amino-7-ketopelargonate synthase n=1 Tax=Aphanothece sacrum FPU1 TaxID=1920663 RepID=A0A401IH71_APHSA|nr:8-amino-7-oxononanoate synthase [Aphanothece sacrum]GBF80579.1 8-amino-7-oxononanoate synthase [Aphanothece sacrum FPU1]GBF84031.1 8-amino-7-oxononanoate synthase [Aphanothece sacrum FPU3]